MGSTQEAIDVFESGRKAGKKIWYGPGKAANCGGVACSGLEMAQNSSRLKWTAEEVDKKLGDIMKECFDICYKTGKEYADEGSMPSLVAGANIAVRSLLVPAHFLRLTGSTGMQGFLKVANAMKALNECSSSCSCLGITVR